MRRFSRAVSCYQPTWDYQVEGMFPCAYMRMSVADLITVCTGLLNYRRPELPKLSIKNNHVERGKAVTPLCAKHSRLTVRQAIRGTAVRCWKKQMPLCNEADKV